MSQASKIITNQSLQNRIIWPKIWPKKPKILTEFVHFDRTRSVGKTCIEISFWPDGHKILTEISTVWQSVKICLWPKILTESRSKILFDRHFRSKLRLWPNFDRLCGQNYANRIPWPGMCWEKFWLKSVKISVKIWHLTEILTDNFGQN